MLLIGVKIRNYEFKKDYNYKYIINKYVKKAFEIFTKWVSIKCYLWKISICSMEAHSNLTYSVNDEC